MIKGITLLRQRADISREQFIDHYDNRHVPLIRQLLPMVVRHVRNYLDLNEVKQLDSMREGKDAPRPYFDTVTEIWFKDQPAVQAFLEAIADPEIIRPIVEDEKKFLDRTVLQFFWVDERILEAAA